MLIAVAARRRAGARPHPLARSRGSAASNVLMLFPLVTPEIVMGVSLLLVFTQLYTFVTRTGRRSCSAT